METGGHHMARNVKRRPDRSTISRQGGKHQASNITTSIVHDEQAVRNG
jgi:hypothetical protein